MPGRILIVDDNPVNRMVLTRALTAQGHATAAAENGRLALDMLRQAQSDGVVLFDVILLDLEMPEMDGFAALREIKSDPALRDLPVIVISGLDEMDAVVRCIEMGAEDYLPKPFNPILLRARIDASLEKKRLRDREQVYLKGLERELEIGRRIQASFLPEEIPQPHGWDIAARFQPAREVAGDFYDVFELGENKIALVVADVCDKGVGAALFMALFRSLMRALALQNFSTPGIVSHKLKDTLLHTNNYIAHTHARANMFATMFFGVLETSTGELMYINAGHEPPVICNATGVRVLLARTGMPVGLFSDAPYTLKQITVAPGEMLFAFTDGIADAQNADGEFFSREKLFALFTSPTTTASEFLARIQARVDAHIGQVSQYDDITMLALRRAKQI
jgi:serine phosphatase RsbU (regulator of sigma subunit)